MAEDAEDAGRDPTPGDESTRQVVGPILYLRGMDGDRLHVAALLAQADSAAVPVLSCDGDDCAGVTCAQRDGWRVVRYAFSLPMRHDAAYTLRGQRYPVDAALAGDLRIAYVSCNGQEWGDRGRPVDQRDVLWERLAQQHAERPFQLLLHGGDQVYADELLQVHPRLRQWAKLAWRRGSGDLGPCPPEAAEALRHDLFRRYLELYSHPRIAWLLARVPSLAMWDDHDICDGWGSLEEAKLDSPVGRTLFEVARENFLLFQLGGATERLPEPCLDPSGETLTWHVALPGLHLVAPDLRSERRPHRVMGEAGWRATREALDAATGGRLLLLSTVPALGPRLSWVEAVFRITPLMQKYEDDLLDQWQSHAHRTEWQDFLQLLVDTHMRTDTRVTVLSGEIHLATRGTLETAAGPLHQLVASGIAHPPPPWLYARSLGALARLGESPLPDHPIALHPLPGQSAIYVAERNYLVLARTGGRWQVHWGLEESGPTPPLSLE